MAQRYYNKPSSRKPYSELMEIIGINIYTERIKQKLTQKEFAKIVGCSVSSIDKYEHGINNIPTVRLVAIAKALNVPIEKLYEENKK